MVIFTFGEMMTMPVSAAYVADLAPAHLRGRYMGAFGLVGAAAMIIGPGLGMKLLTLGATALWLACGALGLVAAIVVLQEVKSQTARAGLAQERGEATWP